MELFPGKIEVIINKKELVSLNKPLKVYEYETKSGSKFATPALLTQGEKVIIINTYKNSGNNYKYEVKNYDLDCEHSMLEELSNSINSFPQKSVYYNYLNSLKWRIRCCSNESYTYTEDIYRVEANDIVLPIHGSRNLRNFENKEKNIFPVCSAILGEKYRNYNLGEKHYKITNKGIYYKIDGYNFPIEYNGNIELFMFGKKFSEFQIKIYCYGFVEIEKWHLVVLSHYLDSIEGFCFLDLPELCREMKKKKEEENIPICDISKCIKEKVFLKGHKILMPYLKKYLNKAVTFFSNKKTKKEVYIKKINKSKLGDSVVEVNILVYTSKITLVVRGISYDWKIGKYNPTIHCNFVTFYPYSPPSIPDKFDYQGKLYIDKLGSF